MTVTKTPISPVSPPHQTINADGSPSHHNWIEINSQSFSLREEINLEKNPM